MKIVVDTNVLISAFLTAGACREVLETIRARNSCVLSPHILHEFRETLGSSKFGFPKGVIDAFVTYLRKHSTSVDEDPKLDLEIHMPDPADQKILALCETVKADFLITGDRELLALKKVGSTVVLPPAQLLKEIG